MAEEELKEGRSRIAKRSRANLIEIFKKWAEEAGEIYEEVENEILWLGGVKFVGEYRVKFGPRQSQMKLMTMRSSRTRRHDLTGSVVIRN
jgi:hypothetical protein